MCFVWLIENYSAFEKTDRVYDMGTAEPAIYIKKTPSKDRFA